VALNDDLATTAGAASRLIAGGGFFGEQAGQQTRLAARIANGGRLTAGSWGRLTARSRLAAARRAFHEQLLEQAELPARIGARIRLASRRRAGVAGRLTSGLTNGFAAGSLLREQTSEKVGLRTGIAAIAGGGSFAARSRGSFAARLPAVASFL